MGEVTRDEVWDSLAPEDRAAIERGTKAYYERWSAGRFPPYEEALADDEGQDVLAEFYRDLIGCPIALRREEKVRAEGARQERERIRGVRRNTAILRLVRSCAGEIDMASLDPMHADIDADWSALLAAITEGE